MAITNVACDAHDLWLLLSTLVSTLVFSGMHADRTKLYRLYSCMWPHSYPETAHISPSSPQCLWDGPRLSHPLFLPFCCHILLIINGGRTLKPWDLMLANDRCPLTRAKHHAFPSNTEDLKGLICFKHALARCCFQVYLGDVGRELHRWHLPTPCPHLTNVLAHEHAEWRERIQMQMYVLQHRSNHPLF